jgi:hypothetical protein
MDNMKLYNVGKNLVLTISCLLLFQVNDSKAQIGIGTETPHESAVLETYSTNKGFLPPRMNNASMIAIDGPTAGLMIYNTTDNCLFVYNGANWTNLCGNSSSASIAALVCSGPTPTEYQGGTITTDDNLDGSEGKQIQVSYTGGSEGPYSEVTIPSVGITGLTATLTAGDLSNGDGTVIFAISGQASGTGTASFPIEFLGRSDCGNIDVNISSPQVAVTPTTYIKDPNPANIGVDDQFGYRIAYAEGSQTMVITNENDLSTTSSKGAIFIYDYDSSDDSWDHSHKITTNQVGFGLHDVVISSDGNTLITALTSNMNSSFQNDLSFIGKIMIYKKSGGTWSTTPIEISASSGGKFFGNELAMNDDASVLVVSEQGGSNGGQIHIYEANGSSFSLAQTFTNPNPNANGLPDNFGNDNAHGQEIAVSGDGTTVAVGHASDDSNDPNDPTNSDAVRSGAVFIYKKQGGSWQQEHYIKASVIGNGDRFGGSVDLDQTGNTLIVGAYSEDSDGSSINNNDSTDAGAVYIFEFNSTTSTYDQEHFIKAPAIGSDDEFGRNVITNQAGTILLTQAGSEDGDGSDINDNSAPNSGAGYLYKKNTTTNLWELDRYIKASTVDGGDGFNVQAISEDGTKLFMSSPGEDSNDPNDPLNNTLSTASRSGAVFYYNIL